MVVMPAGTVAVLNHLGIADLLAGAGRARHVGRCARDSPVPEGLATVPQKIAPRRGWHVPPSAGSE